MDNKGLVLDLLEWIAVRPRRYEDVMDAWRTSCPSLPIWEDTIDAGYAQIEFVPGFRKSVVITNRGKEFLDANQRVHA